MEIEGKIIAVLPERGGVSTRTGNAWKSQEFVIETHDQYPRKCCFRVFGEDRLKQMNIQPGEELRVSIDIDSHEYQGRWFNDISAWRVERIDPMAAQAAADAASAQPICLSPNRFPISMKSSVCICRTAPVWSANITKRTKNAGMGNVPTIP